MRACPIGHGIAPDAHCQKGERDKEREKERERDSERERERERDSEREEERERDREREREGLCHPQGAFWGHSLSGRAILLWGHYLHPSREIMASEGAWGLGFVSLDGRGT